MFAFDNCVLYHITHFSLFDVSGAVLLIQNAETERHLDRFLCRYLMIAIPQYHRCRPPDLIRS